MLAGLDLPSVGEGTEAVVRSPQWGNCLSQMTTFKAGSETADLWQPKWNENQTAHATAIHNPDGDLDSLEGAVSGSWSLGIVKQSQGKVCY